MKNIKKISDKFPVFFILLSIFFHNFILYFKKFFKKYNILTTLRMDYLTSLLEILLERALGIKFIILNFINPYIKIHDDIEIKIFNIRT